MAPHVEPEPERSLAQSRPEAEAHATSRRLTFARHELKFWANEDQLAVFSRALLPYVHEDRGTRESATQRNVSLYLDSPQYAFFDAHVSDAPERVKLRIRSYSEIPEDHVFLEIKEKKNDLTLKHRVAVPAAKTEAALRRRLSPSAVAAGHRKTLERFLFLQQLYRAEPRLFVSSVRTPYTSRCHREDVRVTYDREIRTQPSSGYAFAPRSDRWVTIVEGHARGLHRPPTLIECKFLGNCPRWLGEALAAARLERSAFSKYISAVMRLTGRTP